ncbi:MAG: homoserine kinase [Candidatus Riflebacteria bacterium GWC2_50_8]|nr:MAG: homoserine kinase [Candidatus Riflebacteria bacterium GWC2_50_8]
MTLTVYAPATIANLSVGFDLLGAAIASIDGSCLGDRLSVSRSATGISLVCSGPWSHKLPDDPTQNIVYQCAQNFLERLPEPRQCGLDLKLEKNLPVGSGLGSSASSVVAAFYALNELFERPFSDERLLLLMGEFEGRVSGSVHYDNVAPCFLGGMRLLLQSPSSFCASIPYFKDWYWVVAYPGTSLSTAKMRALLPQEYSRSDMISYGRFLSGFIHASYRNDRALAAAMFKDIVAEPYRSPHIPGYEAAKLALAETGVMASGISGSGPTMFAVTDDLVVAQKAALWLKNNYISEPGGFAHVCQITDTGACVKQIQDTAL